MEHRAGIPWEPRIPGFVGFFAFFLLLEQAQTLPGPEEGRFVVFSTS